jgi:hypothetical protein
VCSGAGGVGEGGVEGAGGEGARGPQIAGLVEDGESLEHELVAPLLAREGSASLTSLKQHANEAAGKVAEGVGWEARLEDGVEEAATELGESNGAWRWRVQRNWRRIGGRVGGGGMGNEC